MTDLGRPFGQPATQQSPSLASRLGPSGECQAQCGRCDGVGEHYTQPDGCPRAPYPVECEECGGTGIINPYGQQNPLNDPEPVDCPDCKGEGWVKIDEQHCPGHIASDNDPKVCRFCGVHADELRPDLGGEEYDPWEWVSW